MKIFGTILGMIWLCVLALGLLLSIVIWVNADTELDKNDYYGEYIVNRDYFPGRQSDWQYNNYRFEIRDNDSIYFYVTDKEKIIKTYRGKINTTSHYSQRLIISMEQPTHHILSSNPTTYRSAWNFYLVFNSPKFNNVYFKKGKWKALDK